MTGRAESFENELRQAVLSLPSPEPSEALLARILEDRKNGHRIKLPTTLPAPVVRPVLIGIAAVAAALALWVTVGRHVSSEDPAGPENSTISEFAVGMGLWPDELYAQAATTSPLAPIPPRDGSLLKTGRWIYWIRTLDEDGRVAAEHPTSVSIVQDAYQGGSAWLLVRQRNSFNPASLVDSVWFSRESLHPLARFSPLAYGANLRSTFTGDSAIRVWRKSSGEFERIAIGLPTPKLWNSAVVTSPNELLPLFLTTQLSAGWQGSFAGTAIANTHELVTLWWDLKVVGEEPVTVPAGAFDCWKVVLLYGQDPAYAYWVDKASGWIIQESLVPTERFVRVLVSHSAN